MLLSDRDTACSYSAWATDGAFAALRQRLGVPHDLMDCQLVAILTKATAVRGPSLLRSHWLNTCMRSCMFEAPGPHLYVYERKAPF